MTTVLWGNEAFCFILLEIKKTNSGELFGSHTHRNEWVSLKKKLGRENDNVLIPILQIRIEMILLTHHSED